jgi:hypothetical protein
MTVPGIHKWYSLHGRQGQNRERRAEEEEGVGRQQEGILPKP